MKNQFNLRMLLLKLNIDSILDVLIWGSIEGHQKINQKNDGSDFSFIDVFHNIEKVNNTAAHVIFIDTFLLLQAPVMDSTTGVILLVMQQLTNL